MFCRSTTQPQMAVLQPLVCLAVVVFVAECTGKRNPSRENRIFRQAKLLNSLQCRRLCWYVKPCVRFSFNRGATDGEDNCFLHGDKSSERDLAEGWVEGAVSENDLPLNHGCRARLCNDNRICVPRRDTMEQLCADFPGFNPCGSGPCKNGGTCENEGGGFRCSCRRGYMGDTCEKEGWLNMTCSSDNDCEWEMTGCFSGICLCKDGYFFSYHQYACVQTCPGNFSRTYLCYKNYNLLNFVLSEHNQISFQTCRGSCTDKNECLMFVHKEQNCWLKNATPQDNPSSWKEDDNFTIYQKTCV